jgi:hypothetical protein
MINILNKNGLMMREKIEFKKRKTTDLVLQLLRYVE